MALKTIADPLVAQASSSKNMLTNDKEVIATVGTADMIVSTGFESGDGIKESGLTKVRRMAT